MIQQGLLDYLYTKDNVTEYQTLLSGRKYLTSNFFPGACPVPVNPSLEYEVTVNTSVQAEWGIPTSFPYTSARRPTGYYLAPGSIGKVTVPSTMVNTGHKILVGAHTTQNSGIDPIKRFFRVFNTYDITDTLTLIANPFGGGIYIISPYLANSGLQEIKLTNVVPAPFFSANGVNPTSLSQWQTVQRLNPAPWADFESDKFLMQLPTSNIESSWTSSGS